MSQMLVLLLSDNERAEEVCELWISLGLRGVTVLHGARARKSDESASMDDLPLFPSIRDFVEREEQPALSLVGLADDDALVDEAVEKSSGLLSAPSKAGGPLLLVLPVTRIVEL